MNNQYQEIATFWKKWFRHTPIKSCFPKNLMMKAQLSDLIHNIYNTNANISITFNTPMQKYGHPYAEHIALNNDG